MQTLMQTARTKCLGASTLATLLFVVAMTGSAGAADTVADRSGLKWMELPALPDTEGFAGMFSGTSHGVLIAAGGANFPEKRPWEGGPKIWHDTIYVLPKPDGLWKTALQALPRPLAYGVSVTYQDTLICIGGDDGQRCYADVYQLEWEQGEIKTAPLPPLPKTCTQMSGALLGDTIYVAGGIETPDAARALHSFWALDLSQEAGERRWRELEPWPGPERMQGVAGVLDGSFFLLGGVRMTTDATGQRTRSTPYLRDAYRYTPGPAGEEGKWSAVSELLYPLAAAPSPAMTAGQTHLLLAGGVDGSLLHADPSTHPGFKRDILAYHAVTDTWIKWGQLPDGSSRVTVPVTQWADGFVMVSGERAPGRRSPKVYHATFQQAKAHFGLLNGSVLVAYLAALVAMGFYFSRREKSTDDFFLGGRRLPWWAVGLSIFSTQLSSITFMSIPALVYRTDWVYFLGNMMLVGVAPIVVYFYLPFFRRLDVTTAYEYLEKRFHVVVRLLGSLAFLLFQFGRMGIVIALPAMALAAVTGLNIYVCIAVMGLLATIYTVLGGIEAVIWSDVLQTVVLLGGGVISLIFIAGGLEGGFSTIYSMAAAEEKLTAFTPGWSVATTAVWVVVVGKLLEQFVPYTADQAVVQRYLTTPDEKGAARGVWTNAVLAVPASLLFFGLGTALWAFYRVHPDRLTPLARHEQIFPWFIVERLPAGVSGLVIAGLFAAAMSTLDSSMNSMATAITTDFFRRFKPGLSDHHCLNLARWLTVLLGVVGTCSAVVIAWLNDASLWDRYVKILGLFGGGLAGLFALGIFTRRANWIGALVGFVASAVVLYLVQQAGAVHFFLYAPIGIGCCLGLGWLASLPVSGAGKNLAGLTIFTIKKVGG